MMQHHPQGLPIYKVFDPEKIAGRRESILVSHFEIIPCMLWYSVFIKIGHFSLLFSTNKIEGLEMSHTNWGQF